MRAASSFVYTEVANEGPKILPNLGDTGVHVADQSRNSLPLFDSGLPRSRTTLDFDTRDPLVASPDDTVAIMPFMSEMPREDA